DGLLRLGRLHRLLDVAPGGVALCSRGHRRPPSISGPRPTRPYPVEPGSNRPESGIDPGPGPDGVQQCPGGVPVPLEEYDAKRDFAKTPEPRGRRRRTVPHDGEPAAAT